MYKFIICILDELKEVINRKWEFIRCEKKKQGGMLWRIVFIYYEGIEYSDDKEILDDKKPIKKKIRCKWRSDNLRKFFIIYIYILKLSPVKTVKD